MAEWYGYFYIESLSLTQQQRQTLINALKGLGLHNQDEHPNERNHWRVRIDQLAVIFEAVFNSDHLTVAALRTRLANIFGINENLITFTTSTNQYGDIVVFKYNSIDRLRVGVFGGRSASYSASQAAANLFLHNFKDDWNIGVNPWP